MNKREKVWHTAFNHVAAAVTCTSSETAIRWADDCLKAFDERFPKKKGTSKKVLYREPGEPYIAETMEQVERNRELGL